MSRVLRTYDHRLDGPEGRSYVARACGRQRDDGTWEGWLELLPDDGSPALRGERETTQPNLTDLAYWADGLSRVYLEGALARAAEPPRPARQAPPEGHPAFDGPAPARARPAAAVLDPFAVAAKGGRDLLDRELAALDERHLLAIAREHGLADERAASLEAMDRRELAALISSRVALRQPAGAGRG